jgi:hypothetical protein
MSLEDAILAHASAINNLADAIKNTADFQEAMNKKVIDIEPHETKPLEEKKKRRRRKPNVESVKDESIKNDKPSEITKDMIKSVIVKIVEKKGPEEAKKVVSMFGSSISEVSEDRYPEFYETAFKKLDE